MTTFANTASIKAASVMTFQTSPAKAAPARKTRLRRQLSRKWDLYGVVTLMASSAVYGLFALAHVA